MSSTTRDMASLSFQHILLAGDISMPESICLLISCATPSDPRIWYMLHTASETRAYFVFWRGGSGDRTFSRGFLAFFWRLVIEYFENFQVVIA